MSRFNLLTAACLALVLSSGLHAQATPVLLVHGVLSDSTTWDTTKPYLNSTGSYSASVVQLDWTQSFGDQSAVVGGRLFALGNASQTILVGHSQGGLISRITSRTTPVAGILTIGTPHAGALIVDGGEDLLADEGLIYDDYTTAADELPTFCDTYPDEYICTGIPDAVDVTVDALNIGLLAVGTGILWAWGPTNADFNDLEPFSTAIQGLESNYTSEQAPQRRAITVDVGDEWAGPFRLIQPPATAEASSNLMSSLGATLWFDGDEVEAVTDPDTDPYYADDIEMAYGLEDFGAFIAGFCSTVWNYQIVGGTPNDAVVPISSQGAMPNATTVRLSVNAAHTEETSQGVFIKTQLDLMTGR